MIKVLVRRFGELIRSVPDGFYDSFAYTRTGQNLTHPLTLGMLVRVVGELRGVAHVAVDLRINDLKGIKFQPDLVGLDARWQPVVVVDYESPNSSDARIPKKDVGKYLAVKMRAPYVVVTTLPDRPAPDWELRYASPGHANDRFAGRLGAVRRNPCRFWYGHYRRTMRGWDLSGVHFVNINGRVAKSVTLG